MIVTPIGRDLPAWAGLALAIIAHRTPCRGFPGPYGRDYVQHMRVRVSRLRPLEPCMSMSLTLSQAAHPLTGAHCVFCTDVTGSYVEDLPAAVHITLRWCAPVIIAASHSCRAELPTLARLASARSHKLTSHGIKACSRCLGG